MNLFKTSMRLLDKLTGGKVSSEFREAATADDDDPRASEYRRLSGTKRDLPPMSFDRQRELGFYVWQRNPVARRMIDAVVQFCTGDDMSVKVTVMKKKGNEWQPQEDREDAQSIWDEFAEHPLNEFYDRLPMYVQDLHIAGELIHPVSVRGKALSDGTIEGDGFVELGYLDSSVIKQVITRPLNAAVVDSVVLQSETNPEGEKFKVVAYDNDPNNKRTFRRLTGEMLYFRLNRTGGQSRGHGFLIEHLDWLDLLDQFAFESLRGFQARNTFFWSVMMKGLTDEQIKKMEQEGTFQVPATASARIHNENVTYEAKSPDLGSIEVDAALNGFQTFIVGTKGFPMTWFGTGEDANRASAGEMAVPTMRMLKALQKNVRAFVRQVVIFVLDQAVIHHKLELAEDEKFVVQVQLFDFERKDAAVLGSAFVQMVTALSIAVEKGWMSEETAKATVDGMLARLGVSVPQNEDVEDLKKKQDEARKNRVDAQVEEDYNKSGTPPDDDTQGE